MSRSVSAPSSVTNTSPCWNGLIVPGSTFRYGSNFCSWTRRPRAFSRRPSEAATIPFPSAETTPPVTKTYFGARALTGFQGSSGCGQRTSAASRASASEGNARPTPLNRGASTESAAAVCSSSAASSSSSASIRDSLSWKASRRCGATSSTSSVPLSCGRRRRRLSRFGPSTCQSAPGATARRTVDSTRSIPGHQSASRSASASTDHTSSTAAGSTRLAANRGKELLSAEHALELGLPLLVAELLDARVRRVAGRLLDPEVAVRERSDLGKMRDRHHLSMLGEPPQQSADGMRGLAADPRVDLVEYQRVPTGDGRDGQRDPRELTARRRLGCRSEREARVRTDERHPVVGAGRARFVALPELADELAVPHADTAKLGGHRVGERGRRRVPLGT